MAQARDFEMDLSQPTETEWALREGVDNLPASIQQEYQLLEAELLEQERVELSGSKVTRDDAIPGPSRFRNLSNERKRKGLPTKGKPQCLPRGFTKKNEARKKQNTSTTKKTGGNELKLKAEPPRLRESSSRWRKTATAKPEKRKYVRRQQGRKTVDSEETANVESIQKREQQEVKHSKLVDKTKLTESLYLSHEQSSLLVSGEKQKASESLGKPSDGVQEEASISVKEQSSLRTAQAEELSEAEAPCGDSGGTLEKNLEELSKSQATTVSDTLGELKSSVSKIQARLESVLKSAESSLLAQEAPKSLDVIKSSTSADEAESSGDGLESEPSMSVPEPPSSSRFSKIIQEPQFPKSFELKSLGVKQEAERSLRQRLSSILEEAQLPTSVEELKPSSVTPEAELSRTVHIRRRSGILQELQSPESLEELKPSSAIQEELSRTFQDQRRSSTEDLESAKPVKRIRPLRSFGISQQSKSLFDSKYLTSVKESEFLTSSSSPSPSPSPAPIVKEREHSKLLKQSKPSKSHQKVKPAKYLRKPRQGTTRRSKITRSSESLSLEKRRRTPQKLKPSKSFQSSSKSTRKSKQSSIVQASETSLSVEKRGRPRTKQLAPSKSFQVVKKKSKTLRKPRHSSIVKESESSLTVQKGKTEKLQVSKSFRVVKKISKRGRKPKLSSIVHESEASLSLEKRRHSGRITPDLKPSKSFQATKLSESRKKGRVTSKLMQESKQSKSRQKLESSSSPEESETSDAVQKPETVLVQKQRRTRSLKLKPSLDETERPTEIITRSKASSTLQESQLTTAKEELDSKKEVKQPAPLEEATPSASYDISVSRRLSRRVKTQPSESQKEPQIHEEEVSTAVAESELSHRGLRYSRSFKVTRTKSADSVIESKPSSTVQQSEQSTSENEPRLQSLSGQEPRLTKLGRRKRDIDREKSSKVEIERTASQEFEFSMPAQESKYSRTTKEKESTFYKEAKPRRIYPEKVKSASTFPELLLLLEEPNPPMSAQKLFKHAEFLERAKHSKMATGMLDPTYFVKSGEMEGWESSHAGKVFDMPVFTQEEGRSENVDSSKDPARLKSVKSTRFPEYSFPQQSSSGLRQKASRHAEEPSQQSNARSVHKVDSVRSTRFSEFSATQQSSSSGLRQKGSRQTEEPSQQSSARSVPKVESVRTTRFPEYSFPQQSSSGLKQKASRHAEELSQQFSERSVPKVESARSTRFSEFSAPQESSSGLRQKGSRQAEEPSQQSNTRSVPKAESPQPADEQKHSERRKSHVEESRFSKPMQESEPSLSMKILRSTATRRKKENVIQTGEGVKSVTSETAERRKYEKEARLREHDEKSGVTEKKEPVVAEGNLKTKGVEKTRKFQGSSTRHR